MRRSLATSLAAVLGFAALLLVAPAGPASAHEERAVGKYHFAVGFGSEPAYVGQENSVQLLLHDAGDRPVTDLGDTLSVEVVYGSQSMTLPLEPNFEVGEFGIPGDYRAWFFPTQAGDYTFHFTGSIKGQNVDQRFTSGPSTFSAVEDPSKVQFPSKEPPVSQVAALAQRLSTRLQTAMAAQRRAQDAANSAKTIGYVGIGVGALGLVLGASALAMSRRRAVAPSAPQSTATSQTRS
jgi:hypothetical protein